MAKMDWGPYDVLTGHAGARFRWIDVRPDPVRKAAPANADAALPLAQLLEGSPLPYDRDTSLAVFGEGLEDTQRAVKELRGRGHQEVLAMSGERYGGYEWIVHVGLAEP
jgi:hypothetical protein